MSLILYKIIASLLLFFVSVVTIIYPLKRKKRVQNTESLELGEALASGIFLGAAFFHLLPDAVNAFVIAERTNYYLLAEIVCVTAFLCMLFLEHLSLKYYQIKSEHTIPYVLTLILTLHALIEGLALGMLTTFSETLLLFIAIVAHKGSESFALCVTLLRHKLPIKNLLIIVLFFSFMTPLGIILGQAMQFFIYNKKGFFISGMFNAFAAGTFIYISTLHHLNLHGHTKPNFLEFLYLLLGATAMGLLALWA